MTLQAVFVYGSARPGEPNYWFGEAVEDTIRNVTTPGRLTHNGAYPYMATMTDAEQLVIGDLLLCNTARSEFRMFEDMELGAGYQREDIAVHSIRLGTDVGAVAFTIPLTDRRMALPRVPGGDWPRFRRLHLR
jgi:gamma-glutamylcyclotransferase (GGCT)/AIG2-like uncharacterized protein YtfP